MKVAITGADGMLARAIARVADAQGDAVLALPRAALDVTDRAAVEACLEAERPDVVVQCAAYTAVDRAEAEPALAHRINVDGAEIVARACQKIGAVFVYPSSDYVFDGEGSRPYRPSDPPNPLNVYGRTKWLGEQAAAEADRALVVRTSWLYGSGGPHFVETMIRAAGERPVLDVVSDQVGRPTWTVSLAATLFKLLKAGALGTFHASDGGDPVSWAGFAREILRRVPAGAAVRSISSSEFQRAAVRPKYSVLDLEETERVVGEAAPRWTDSLTGYLDERGGDAPSS